MADVPVYLVFGFNTENGDTDATPASDRAVNPSVAGTRFIPEKSLRDSKLSLMDSPTVFFTNPGAVGTQGDSAGNSGNSGLRVLSPGRIASAPVPGVDRQNLYVWNHIGPTAAITGITLGGTVTFTTRSAHGKTGTFDCFPMGFGTDTRFGLHDYGIDGLDGKILTATVTGANTFTVSGTGVTGSGVLGTARILTGTGEVVVDITAATLVSDVVTLTTASHSQTGDGVVLVEHLRGVVANDIGGLADPFIGDARNCSFPNGTTITTTIDSASDAVGLFGYVGTGAGGAVTPLGSWDIYNPDMNSTTVIASGEPTVNSPVRLGRYTPDIPVSKHGYDAALLRRISDMEFERTDFPNVPVYVMKAHLASPLRGRGSATPNSTLPRHLKRYSGEIWDELTGDMITRAIGALVTAGDTPIIRGVICSLGAFEYSNFDLATPSGNSIGVTSIAGDVITLATDHGLTLPADTGVSTLAVKIEGVSGLTPVANDVWDVVSFPTDNTVQISQTFTGTSSGGRVQIASAPFFVAEDISEWIDDARTDMIAAASSGQAIADVPAVFVSTRFGFTGPFPEATQLLMVPIAARAAGLTENCSLADLPQNRTDYIQTLVGSDVDGTLSFDSYARLGLEIFNRLDAQITTAVAPVGKGVPIYMLIGDSYLEGLPFFSWALTNDGDYDGSEVAGRDAKIYDWNTDAFKDYSTQDSPNTFPSARSGSTVSGWEASLILELTRRHPGEAVFIVKMGISGSRLGMPDFGMGIDAWNNNNGTVFFRVEEAYDRVVAEICSLGLVPDMRGCFVNLGTNDAVNTATAQAFVDELPQFVIDLRAALSSRTDPLAYPIIWGQAIKHPDNTDFHTNHDTMRAALTIQNNNDAQFGLVDLDSVNFGSRFVTEIPISPDQVHISLAGQIRMGILMNRGFDLVSIYGNVMVEPNPLGVSETV